MTTKELHEAIEKAGDANDYNRQAGLFLEHTGTRIEARYLRTGAHFSGNDDARDIYEVCITRGQRTHTLIYGDSIASTEERLTRIYAALRDHNPASPTQIRAIRRNGGTGDMSAVANSRAKVWHAEHAPWKDVTDPDAGDRPSAYSILACLTKHEPEEDVDDYAAEYGFEKPSEAIRVHAAVLAEWKAMQALFTDAEIEALQLIN